MARIIVAEDDQQIAYLLEFRLEDEGHEVVLVTNGELLLEELAKAPADLLVLDIMMPKMDGLAALKNVREQGNDVPAIILSALGRPENRAIADELGVIAYLTKPFEPDVLVAHIAAALT